MNAATTRVDFHCHSSCSDGALRPVALADRLAQAGVAFAALTDHDCIDGLTAFRERLAQHGIGCLDGVEITTRDMGREAHLLAYGFAPGDAGLGQALAELRQAREPERHRVADSLRQRHGPGPAGCLAEGQLDIAEAIRLVHAAGGRAFLAHPHLLEPDLSRLPALLERLKALGLDGIEAYHGSLDSETRERLGQMADAAGLLVCAGSDTHATGTVDDPAPGIDLPTERWQRFRAGLGTGVPLSPPPARRGASPHWRLPTFFLHIVLPTVLAILLFSFALFGVFLPTLEESLLDRKREMIRELANSAWSYVAEAERNERAGLLTREQAQEMARTHIQALRYGREGKDYFWIQDMQPRIVMHPYRTDLNGQDVSGFRDPRGVRIFVAFADMVRRQQEGYVQYVWQWKDDPRRMAAKESYVRGFAPWGWIIGTGIYIEDVRQEIARFERHLVHMLVGISVLVALLLLYAIRQSLRLERERSEAEAGLRHSTERYRSLVEATTEGTLLVLGGRCQYANPVLLRMLGYAERDIALLDLTEILPPGGANGAIHDRIQALSRGEETAGGLEGRLRRRNGHDLDCVVTLSPIHFAGQSGLILLVRDMTPPPPLPDEARATAQARLDAEAKRAAEREALIERLQASLLFLHEPVERIAPPPVFCRFDTPADRVASLMVGQKSSAALIQADSGDILGIVTDQALRDRIVAVSGDARSPIHRVMSSPVISVGRTTQVYEALLLMQEQNIDHLPVTDDDGTFVGVLANRDILQRHSYGALVLTREIAQAATPEEVARWCRRGPGLAKALLDCGAHPRSVTRLVADVCDAATERLVALAIAQLGPPPAEFAFVALGSQARQEQTLLTDQDNAILYDGPASAAADRYFGELGRQVCAGLDQSGYAFCRGKIMAMNPKWCRPLTSWKERFTAWIVQAEPQELLDFAIFFDLRTVAGQDRLRTELRAHIDAAVQENPAFLPHLARSALQFRPPTRWFGIPWRCRHGAPLDLKAALLPLVGFARVYALRHGLAETHTLDRIDALARRGVVSAGSRTDLAATHDFLLRLRLRHQAEASSAGLPLDNQIDPRRLGRLEQTQLGQAFDQIDAVRKRIGCDLLGGTAR